MLKKIALCGLFAFASLFTLGTASAGGTGSAAMQIGKVSTVDQVRAPVGHGMPCGGAFGCH